MLQEVVNLSRKLAECAERICRLADELMAASLDLYQDQTYIPFYKFFTLLGFTVLQESIVKINNFNYLYFQ